MTATNQRQAAALAAAGRGWRVFPLTAGDKRPALHGESACPGTGACAGGHAGWEQRATSDPDRITTCWRDPRYNIGLATGPSGLVVVDLDTPKPGHDTPPEPWRQAGICDGHDVFAALCEQAGQPLALALDTYTVATASGGTHLYYQHPQGGPRLRNTAGALGWLIDTRAHGGYVVAAGSVVAGRAYRVVHDVDPAPLPAWLTERLTPTQAPPPAPTEPVRLPPGRYSAYVRAALDRQVRYVLRAGQGRRNDALYRSAVAIGQLVAGHAVDADHARAVLTRAALEAGLRPRETDRTISSGFADGAKRPRNIADTGVAA